MEPANYLHVHISTFGWGFNLAACSVKTASVGDVRSQLHVSVSYVKMKTDAINSNTRQRF